MILSFFEDNRKIWTSLVLGFDNEQKISLITTLKQGIVENNWKDEYKKIVDYVQKDFWKCSIGIFANIDRMKNILSGKDPRKEFLSSCLDGEIIVDPSTDALKSIIKRFSMNDLS